jgi:imidazolonepropionase-like amidohydrolase
MFTTPLLMLGALAQVALAPDAIVAADGSLQTGKVVVIEDGRISRVADAAPSGMTAHRLQGVLAPGMIDAVSSRGADRFLTEQSDTLTPELRAADGLDLDASAWEALLARGVTAVHVVPDPTNPLAGQGALVACSGPDGIPTVLVERTVQVASMIQSAINDDRVGPSSLSGALELLRGAAQGRSWSELPLWGFVENAEGLRGLSGIADQRKHHAILWGDLGSYAGAAAGELVLLPTFGEGELARRAASWRAMHGQDIRFAFGTRGGNAEWNSLRTSAMALSRFTGDAAAAWQAVSLHPAEAMGQADLLGSIAPGRRADLVLWSAHPLDATARVEAVMVGGETVFRASAP